MKQTEQLKAELEEIFFNASLNVSEIEVYRAEIIRLGKLNPTKITGDHLLSHD